MEQTPIQQEQERARLACEHARRLTPEPYLPYLIFMRRTRKIGQQSITVDLPYLTVDGRIAWAVDEHRARDGTLEIDTTFETEPTSGQVVCKAVITSSLYGRATGHARAVLGGSGADATNPLENAETSAVGRALGFLGYGIYGAGIASADDMQTLPPGDDPPSGADDKPSVRHPDGQFTRGANTVTPSGGGFDRSKEIRRLYVIGQESGLNGDEVEAYCRILSPLSRRDWSPETFMAAKGEGAQGLAHKSREHVYALCRDQLTLIMKDQGLGANEIIEARQALALPAKGERDLTFEEMARLAEWMRDPASGVPADHAALYTVAHELREAVYNQVDGQTQDFIDSVIEQEADSRPLSPKQEVWLKDLQDRYMQQNLL
jgi:hypothetical protein